MNDSNVTVSLTKLRLRSSSDIDRSATLKRIKSQKSNVIHVG